MPDPAPAQPRDLSAELDAFVDGELDDAGRLRVLDHLARHPAAARGLLNRQHLRTRVGKVLATPAAAVPADLRRKLADLAIHEPIPLPPAAPQAGSSPGLPGEGPDAFPRQPAAPAAPARDPYVISAHPRWNTLVGRWSPLAAAALFFVAALVALQVAQTPASLGDGSIVPAAQVEQFQARHSRCGRAFESLFNAATVTDVAAVPDVMRQRLGRTGSPLLDLSELGYQFAGVGDCTIPGGKSLHLLYRADPQSGRDDALSLWIEPDPGTLPLEEGRPYPITTDDAAHPMIVWRDAGMVYYLVGDAPKPVAAAAKQLCPRGTMER